MPVAVEGLAQLRTSLRAIDRDALKEVQSVTKRAAEIVAVQSRTNAPHKTGKLSASIKARTSGNKGIVGSKLPYAKVHEFGGTIAPKGAPITIKASRYIDRALESKSDEVARELETGLDQVLTRHGWK